MYKNKGKDGRNNICGPNIKKFRLSLPEKPSQRAFSDMLRNKGLDVDKNAIQRIESGARFVTDIELKAIAEVLGVSSSDLLDCIPVSVLGQIESESATKARMGIGFCI